MFDPEANRRPLATRRRSSAHRLAGRLGAAGITPDQISAAGIGFAGLAAAALLAAGGAAPLWLVAGVFIQLRLLANLLDGLVAVEGGHGGRLGPMWNEVPDRIEDTAIIVAYGAATAGLTLGLWTALAAMACAYLRLLGGALGQPQSFLGPMAKQHRMAALTLGCVLGFAEALAGRPPLLAGLMLWLVLAGSLVTMVRRVLHIAGGLGR